MSLVTDAPIYVKALMSRVLFRLYITNVDTIKTIKCRLVAQFKNLLLEEFKMNYVQVDNDMLYNSIYLYDSNFNLMSDTDSLQSKNFYISSLSLLNLDSALGQNFTTLFNTNTTNVNMASTTIKDQKTDSSSNFIENFNQTFSRYCIFEQVFKFTETIFCAFYRRHRNQIFGFMTCGLSQLIGHEFLMEFSDLYFDDTWTTKDEPAAWLSKLPLKIFNSIIQNAHKRQKELTDVLLKCGTVTFVHTVDDKSDKSDKSLLVPQVYILAAQFKSSDLKNSVPTSINYDGSQKQSKIMQLKFLTNEEYLQDKTSLVKNNSGHVNINSIKF